MTSTRRRRSVRLALLAGALVVAVGVSALGIRHAHESDVAAASGRTVVAGTAARPFAGDSAWNTPIPADARLDPQSSAIRRAVLANPSLVMNVETYSFGIPFYTATPSTPRVRLHGRADHGQRVPIDPAWRPNTGGDHKMNVIDPVSKRIYELQGYDAATRSAYWMVVRNYAKSHGDGRSSGGRRGPTGAGISQAAGTIRIADIRRGRIDHALAFVTSAPLKGRYRYPATSTDGTSRKRLGVEEGMRVQLDPKLDLDSLQGLSKAERMIARALQRYGAFCVDNGGGNNQALGFYAEQPTPATGDPYAAVGLRGDWVQLPNIPRSALRVVAESVTVPR